MNEQKLKEIFSSTFQIDASDVTDSLEYKAIPSWDSIGHMALVSELDETFDIMLDTDDIIDMSSFKKTKEILVKYGVDF
jgi:acyl carrier protein